MGTEVNWARAHCTRGHTGTWGTLGQGRGANMGLGGGEAHLARRHGGRGGAHTRHGGKLGTWGTLGQRAHWASGRGHTWAWAGVRHIWGGGTVGEVGPTRHGGKLGTWGTLDQGAH